MNPRSEHRIDGISFCIGETRALAVPSDVFAIEESPKLAFVPGTRPYFLGFFKYASRYIPCFDIASFCGLPTPAEAQMSCLIAPTESSSNTLAALWVSHVGTVRDFSVGTKASHDSKVPLAIGDYVANSCQLTGETYLLLDLKRLATDLISKSVTFS